MTANLKSSPFGQALQGYFPELHGARRKFLEIIIPAIAKASSVVLRRIACAFEGQAQVDSVVRRIQRFLAESPLCQKQQARFIIGLLGIIGPMTLALDRTNWKFGQRAINILMLSVQWNGKAIPLFWQLLDKEGNSNQAERIDLLQLFLDTFGANAIYNLTADREFIGCKWFHWLIEQEIPFDIRIKSNTIVERKGRTCSAWELFRAVKRGKIQRRNGQFKVYGSMVYLSGGPAVNKKGEDDFFIIASYCGQSGAAQRYALRWRIEQLFKELKSSGFCLEDTQVVDSGRLSNLLALLAITYCWMVKTGRDVTRKVPRLSRKLKHGRPRYSTLRIGLDAIREAFWSGDKRLIAGGMRFLSCT
ncbi:MAG: IS4 family transposase [Alphaproteobacteria bacterium]|nr:IS4 family transposase [Alphaproteobacteria bacterium]